MHDLSLRQAQHVSPPSRPLRLWTPRSSRSFGILALAAVTIVAWLPGCSAEPESPPTRFATGDGAAKIGAVDIDTQRITLGPVTLLGLGPAPASGPPLVGLALRKAKGSTEMKFGAFKITEADATPWQGVATIAELIVTKPSGATPEATFNARDATGAVVATGRLASITGGVALEITASGDHNRASIAFPCQPDEHFIGLGGQSFDVDHRGRSVPLWVSEDGITKKPGSERPPEWIVFGSRHTTHTPMPIYLSSKGYALVLETPARAIFHLCSEADNVVRIESWEGRLKVRVFTGATPLVILDKLTAWLGRPRLPPDFTFAPWLDAVGGSAKVRAVAKKLRDEGVASSVIWTEDWRGGVGSGVDYTLEEDWRLDTKLYPDFTQLAKDLHGLGFKFLTYHNTFLSSTADVYPEAIAKGYWFHKRDETGTKVPYRYLGPTGDLFSLLDLTNPDGVTWAKSIYAEGFGLGADGWMADFAEWAPTDCELHDGSDPMLAHNPYPVWYQQLNRDIFDAATAKDGVERLFFVRSGWLGSQPLVDVMWAGDQQTDFTEGDGLPSVIPMAIGLGVTGFPYFAHDIAGYMSAFTEPSDKELFFRWTSFGALSPVMRTHHGKSAGANWRWDSDAETLAHFAFWARLHIRLFPYFRGLADQNRATGAPLMRALALHFPAEARAWTSKDSYLLGDRLLVAPIVTKGATARQVWLPEGAWWPLLGGAKRVAGAGGVEVTVVAKMTEIPAFVPAGTVLVLLPDGVDTLTRIPGQTVPNQVDAGDTRELWLYRGGASAWTDGAMTTTWNAGALSATPTTGTWTPKTGTPAGVVATEGAFQLVGQGTLSFAGDAALVLVGGSSDRKTAVRVR